MREHDVSHLLVAGLRAREMYESYLADDYNEGCVVFPQEGEPVVLTWAHLRVMRARDSAERGYPLWIADYRVATSGRAAAATEIFGAIPAGWWLDFSEALPGCEELNDIPTRVSHR
jgi:hypothetical protein